MKCVYSYPWVITAHILCFFPFEILVKQKKIRYKKYGRLFIMCKVFE